MSRPSWDDAPEFANWLTMDKGGFWTWRELKPYAMFDFWSRAGSPEGMSQYAGRSDPDPKTWSASLEKRP